MSSYSSFTCEELSRLIGRPEVPALVDVRTDEDFADDPRLVPGSVRRHFDEVEAWAPEIAGEPTVVICRKGQKLSQGAAAWLRHLGTPARSLEGGAAAWADAGLPLVPAAKLPPPGSSGSTLWVTRERPKVDRIACPWLIRRFIDRRALFLFVEPSEVQAAAERFGATPFDIEGVFWSHRGPLCSFDVMVEEFGLSGEALDRLAVIVRGADTARLELAPEAAGLLAACLGLSRLHNDDLAQLAAGLALFDAYYCWSLEAVGETHGWPSRMVEA